MRTRPTALVALSAAVFAAACTEAPFDPTTPDVQPSFATVAGTSAAAAGPNFFVVSQVGALPENFSDAVTAVGGNVEALYAQVGVAVVSNLSPAGARSLRQLKGIGFVEQEPVLSLDEPTSVSAAESVGAGGSTQGHASPASAFFFPRQWNMRQVDAPGAWAAGRLGSGNVTVAILDTGIDYLYPDLVGRVDLTRSASFVPLDDLFASIFFPSRHLVTDLHWHGTHVASTVVSNGHVIAGVTSQVTLIGAKVCSFQGGCPGSSIFAGIVHAVTNEAHVVNMSLGGSFSKRQFPGAVSAFQRLFNWANQQGTTFVVSAGNSAADLDHDKDGFKTYCTVANVVCVSATGPTSSPNHRTGPWENPDAPASYTNFGRSAISVAAPGGTGAGFVWAGCSTSSLIFTVCGSGPTFILGAGGTSMAAPHASGAAALIAEDVGRNPAQIRARLQQSADDLGQPGVDPFYGKGRVNVAAAAGVN